MDELDKHIEKVREVYCFGYTCSCELITELEVKDLCDKAKELLLKEDNVHEVHTPITVRGGPFGKE